MGVGSWDRTGAPCAGILQVPLQSVLPCGASTTCRCNPVKLEPPEPRSKWAFFGVVYNYPVGAVLLSQHEMDEDNVFTQFCRAKQTIHGDHSFSKRGCKCYYPSVIILTWFEMFSQILGRMTNQRDCSKCLANVKHLPNNNKVRREFVLCF